jgi:cysteine dioxygenase
VNKYTFWDGEKPYTRNLVHTDNENYTLLMLCWNGGRESSIHNHPCEGCFIKTIRGCIRETRYEVHEETNEIRRSQVKFFNEGQVSFMHDSIGLHKIGNPNKDTGSVTLHLYTPPFKSCRVWNDCGPEIAVSSGYDVSVGYFSVMGQRSPNLEGKPGTHAQVMWEIPKHAAAFYDRKNCHSE